MKRVKFDKLTRYAILTYLLWGGASLSFTALADPTGIGDCQYQEDPMTGAMGWIGHPCPQPRPGLSTQTNPEPGVTRVITPDGHFPSVDPFANPPGSNFLMTVYTNLYDFNGDEMPNTLPSTPTVPYNLHDGPVLTRDIDPTNPEDDLDNVIGKIEQLANNGEAIPDNLINIGLAILEGDPIPGYPQRAYTGFPMLHYNGPNKVKRVKPICINKNGVQVPECGPKDTVVGGNVDVNMIYYNQRIESDTAFVDPSDVLEVPWTMTYRVKILNRGMEDFSPMVMNFDSVVPDDAPRFAGSKLFHASMDQTYFPMLREGTEYTVKIKQNKGKYFNLTYTWGWRIHPPRVQVMENALKKTPNGVTLPEWEKIAFCQGGQFDNHCDPVHKAQDRLYAISQIGDLSPAKRMWNIFRALKEGGNGISDTQATVDLRAAFMDWIDKTKLPAGVEADPESTITLLYVNNTIYGSRQGTQGAGSGLGPASYKGIQNGSAHDWNTRPYEYRVTILNADHYMRGYMNVDFGGSRGWENQFQYTDPTTAHDPDGIHTGPTVIEGRRFTVVDGQIVLGGEENVFPINRGGIEEFLKPSPRNPEDPDNGPSQLGSGCFFTFGRNHAWANAGGPNGPIVIGPAAADGTPTRHVVEIQYNFEPSRRLRIYQFDPLHHDVAIYSLH